MRINNRLRSFFVALLSIVIVMSALPLNVLRVQAAAYAYKITYYANNGTGQTYLDIYDTNDSSNYTVKPNMFAYTGYEFAFWSTSAGNLSGKKYDIGSPIPVEGDDQIYAHWRRAIIFHNPGKSETRTQKVLVGETAALAANTFTNSAGKTFFGWTKEETGTTIDYVDGASVYIQGKNTEDVKDLYALWAYPCTIQFDANDADLINSAAGSMGTQVVGIGLTMPLISNGYSVDGYTFKGWTVDPSVTGVTINDDGTIILDDTFTGSTLTLKAKWEGDPRTITFKNEDGTSTISTVEGNFGSVPSPTPAAPDKTSSTECVFTFDGWTDAATGTFYSDLPVVSGDDPTYYAHYSDSPRPYAITASNPSEGGTVSISGGNKYGEEAKATVDLKTGYHVVKWINNGTAVDSTALTYSFTVKGDHDISIVLEKDSYDVTVKCTEGGTATASPKTATEGTKITVSATPDSGYEIDKITYTPNGGIATDITSAGSFTMPGKNVSVDVLFKKKASPVTPTDTPVEEASFEDFVERLYVVALNRASESEGKAFWCEHVGNGDLTGAACAREFLTSAEFHGRGLSDEEFLKVLYKTFFDRDAEADPDGFNFWMNSLKTQGRDTVVEGFINSTEWCNVCARYGVRSGASTAKATEASAMATAFAERLYTKCLGRDAEPEGLKWWSLALTNLDVSGSTAARGFFESQEFIGFNTDEREYLTRLYRTFMGREPDDGGKNYWLDSMAQGMTREQVFDCFVSSPEFTDICKSYGIDR